jgi:hypothetical protein
MHCLELLPGGSYSLRVLSFDLGMPWLTCRAPVPDTINSAEYEARILEVGILEVVGRGRSLRRPA